MNISLDKQSVTDGLLKIKLQETDYMPKVEEKVKEYSRKASIKGFRQGKVPSGVIKKMFGKSILVEEVNHIVMHGVNDYIRDNKLRILGDPLPDQEKAKLIDWDNQKEFEFEFQLGMVDDFKYELSSKVKVTSHPIEVSDKVIDETVEDITRRYGQVSYPEVSEASDNLHGEIVKGDATAPNPSYLPIEKVEGKAQKKFIGVKKEETITFNIEDIKDENVRAQVLNVDVATAKDSKGPVNFKVTNITRVTPAALDVALFERTFGKDSVTTEEEFRKKIRETISSNYDRETTHLLDHELMHYYVDNTKIEMPENFLKKWIMATSEGQVDDDVMSKEFNSYKESLKWDLIKNKIAEDQKITVEDPDVRERAKILIEEQFGGPGIAAQLGEKFDAIVGQYLVGQDGKGENYRRIFNQVRNEKIMKVIRESITVTEKKVSLEEFQKIAAEHNH